MAALVVLDAVVTPLCGSFGDRFDRQRVMLLACGGGAVCYAGMFLAADHVWVVFALACLSTVFESLYFPASNAALPRLLPEANLGSLFAAFAQVGTAGGLLGPALVAGLSLGAGVEWALLVNALSFVPAGVLVASIRRAFGPGGSEEPAPDGDGATAGALPASDRRHVLVRFPVLWSFMGLWAAIQLGTGAMWVLLPLLAERLGNAEVTYSGLNTWSVVATMAGMFVVARLTERHGAVRLLQGGLAAQVLGFLGLALAVVVAGLPALVVTALALLVHRGGQAFTGASSYDLLAHAVPDEARARSTSWVDFATIGAFGLGVWAAGPLADLAGLGALSLVSAGLLALSMLAARQLGRVARRQGFDGTTPGDPMTHCRRA